MNPEAVDRLDYERVSLRIVAGLLCKKTHVAADPPGNDPKAVMLDFVDPTLARGSFHNPGREAGPETV